MNNAIIEQILSSADIVKIIGKHVELKRSGGEFKGCCPFHGEKTPSFFVNPQKGLYNCFGCGVKGNALTFLKEFENMTAGEALKELSRQTGIELPKDEQKQYTYQKKPAIIKPVPTPQSVQNSPNYPNLAELINNFSENSFINDIENLTDYTSFENFSEIEPETIHQSASLYDLLDQICQFYQEQLQKNPIAKQYFYQRGLSDATIQEFLLGYAPNGWQHLEEHFPQDIEGLKILGLVRQSQKGNDFNLLRDRVIFPIRENQGRVIGFAGRALSDEILPKYINSSDSPVFHKQNILYGLYEGRKAKATNWLVVEGYMDVISLHQAGVYGAVASMGTAIATQQIERLLQLNPILTLSFDGDSAGQKASWRAMESSLPVLTDGKELRFLTLPNHHDPDSFVKAYGKTAMEQEIAKAIPLSQYLFSALSQKYNVQSAEDKSKILKDIGEISKKLPKGSYAWLLREDIRNRLGFFGKKSETYSAKDALINFASGLTPNLLLQLCFLYQPNLLIGEQLYKIPSLVNKILYLSKANKVAFFQLQIDKQDLTPVYPIDEIDYHATDDEIKSEIARTERLLQAEKSLEVKTLAHLEQFPLQPLTWQNLADNQTFALVEWIVKVEQNLYDLESQINSNFAELTNAKAHFILAGLDNHHREILTQYWLSFFHELTSRQIDDITDLSIEILTKQLIICLQSQMISEKNLTNKSYYGKQRQVIYDWYQKWSQQRD